VLSELKEEEAVIVRGGSFFFLSGVSCGASLAFFMVFSWRQSWAVDELVNDEKKTDLDDL
jgi:hypothetical protein